MKYREETIPKSSGELRDRISDTMLSAPRRQFRDGYDFDGAFFSMSRGVENLRGRLGNAKADQLAEMLALSKAHYEASDNKLGGALMEDTKMVLMGRQPWAYPKERYRWSIDPALPEVSEADLLNKEWGTD